MKGKYLIMKKTIQINTEQHGDFKTIFLPTNEKFLQNCSIIDIFLIDTNSDLSNFISSTNIKELNYLANIITSLDINNIKKLSLIINECDFIDSIKDLINIIFNIEEYELLKNVHNESELKSYLNNEYGHEYLDDVEIGYYTSCGFLYCSNTNYFEKYPNFVDFSI